MFEATLEKGDVFKKLIAAIGDLVKDANLDCGEDGIRLQAMDSSHVSLVNLFLSTQSFSSFECSHNHTLGINFAALNKLLKCSKPKDSITMRHDDDSDTLQFVFTDESYIFNLFAYIQTNKSLHKHTHLFIDNERTLNFELKLMDIDSERLVIPDTEYRSTVRMSSKEFRSLCSDLQTIGDSLGIACNKEAVKFSLVGDIGQGDITYNHSDDIDDIDDMDKNPNVALIRCDEAISQSFALRYLSNFSKAAGLSKCVTIFLSTDVPLVTEYKIDDIGHLKYYLAPKIEDE